VGQGERVKVHVVPAAALGPPERGRWAELQRASPLYRSPFFRPEFTAAVARVRDVRVAVIEDGGVVAGFFPFEVGRRRNGRPVGRPFSDYHGVVIDDAAELDPRALVRACGLATWSFDHLPAGLAAFAPYALAHGRSPYLDLAQGFEAYLADRRGRSDIRGLARKARRLARDLGPPRFVANAYAPSLLDRLVAWKRLQYAQTGVRDVLADAGSRGLLRVVHESRCPGFSGMLSVLYAGDLVAGMHLGLRSGPVLHGWFPAYNSDLHRYSPGLLLMLALAEAAPALGIAEIDLGKGDARYKQALASGSVALYEGRVGSHPLSGRIRTSARRTVRRAGVHRAVRRVLRRRRAR
jgi:CelD/BcsL family acetyltransferase involved in cellulose biosynthesis